MDDCWPYPHNLIVVAGMTPVVFLAWRADHPGIEDEPKRLKSTTQPQAVPSIARLRLKTGMRSADRALEAKAYAPEPARGEAVGLLHR